MKANPDKIAFQLRTIPFQVNWKYAFYLSIYYLFICCWTDMLIITG